MYSFAIPRLISSAVPLTLPSPARSRMHASDERARIVSVQHYFNAHTLLGWGKGKVARALSARSETLPKSTVEEREVEKGEEDEDG